MSLLRCIAILTIFVFSILAINPVFAIKLHGDGHHRVNIGGQVATVAWAYAQATDAADAGAYSIYAQVDSNWSARWTIDPRLIPLKRFCCLTRTLDGDQEMILFHQPSDAPGPNGVSLTL